MATFDSKMTVTVTPELVALVDRIVAAIGELAQVVDARTCPEASWYRYELSAAQRVAQYEEQKEKAKAARPEPAAPVSPSPFYPGSGFFDG